MSNLIVNSLLFTCLVFSCLCLESSTGLAEESCQCQIDMSILQKVFYQPIYLNATSDLILYPDPGPGGNNSIIVLNTGDDLKLHCTGYKGMLIGNVHYSHISTLQLKCLYQWQFETPDIGEVNLKEVRCVQPIIPTAKETFLNCGITGLRIDVGFNLGEGKFLHQYMTCFNSKSQTTEFTYSIIHPKGTKNRFIRHDNFPIEIFFNLSQPVNRYYTRDEYKRAIDRQLGRTSTTSLFFLNSGLYVYKYYLVTPLSMYYDFEQASTMYYLNIVPHFSGTPWFTINRFINLYSLQKNVKLHIYTGTWQVTKILHFNRTNVVKLYLDDEAKQIPIPGIIWKTVYDEENEAGVALIAINNYLLRGKYTTLCPDISSRLPFLNENTRKYVYACKYHTWRKIVKVIPQVRVTEVLGQNLVFPRPEWKKREKYFGKL